MWVLHTTRRMPASANQTRFIEATEELTRANDILRTSWMPLSSGDWAGVVLRSSSLDIIRAECQDEAEGAAIAEQVWAERFTFGKPFIRYATATYPSGEWDLIIKMDHAVYDGTLLRVFDSHFAAILNGQPVPKPGAEFREFCDYAYSDVDRAASEAYWARELAGKPADGLLARNASPKITAFVREKIETIGLDERAGELGVTPSVLFQGAFEVWLSRFAGNTLDVNFDYLISGRNVPLAEPQSINGTLATFVPIRSRHRPEDTTASLLSRIQDQFWEVTERADLSLDDIYKSASAGSDKEELSRAVHGNSVLFLFQPFDPVGSNLVGDTGLEDRWLVMAKSKVRMLQPYALVIEVAKTPAGTDHMLKFMYDETMFSRDEASRFAAEIGEITREMIAA